MKALIALEELIKEDEAHIKLAKKQLAAHESGENKLSKLNKASTEATLHDASERLEKNRLKLQELMKLDIAELEKEERIRDAVIRKNYYHYQKSRIKRNKTHSNDVKIEAMMIIDELPKDKDVGIEDDILLNIAEKSFKMQLSLHERIDDRLMEIKQRFEDLLGKTSEEEISELILLDHQIAIMVLHLAILIENIEQIIEDTNEKNKAQDKDELPPFKGLPKFEDWWITELWSNHQAYFGLYKWKQIIAGLCLTSMQKEAWDIIFAKWVHIKQYIFSKGTQAYKYNFAFDSLAAEYCDLEEELSLDSLKSMESIIQKLSQMEDFTKQTDSHALITEYAQFKKEMLHVEDKEKKSN
jgi:hypothetical protein